MPQPRSPAADDRQVRIRLGTQRDLPLLVRHRRSMFLAIGVEDRRQLAQADLVYARWFRAQHRAKRLMPLIALAGKGEVVASGVVWLQERQPRPGFDGPWVPYLMSMFTERSWRGQGIATRLVERAIRWCKAKGHQVLMLHASPQGMALYQRLGFLRTQEYSLRFAGLARPAGRRRRSG